MTAAPSQELQTCSKCGRELPRASFCADSRLKRGTAARCKECLAAKYAAWAAANRGKRNESNRAWRENHPGDAARRGAAYYAANRERLLLRSKARESRDAAAISARRKHYYAENRAKVVAKVGEYTKRRRAEDPVFRARANLRSRFGAVLHGARKSGATMALVGCTLAQLRAHLESLFAAGMSWDNYGEWHIDHIMPCAAFNLLDPSQQAECFHFSNLQPLWAADNIRKSAKAPLAGAGVLVKEPT